MKGYDFHTMLLGEHIESQFSKSKVTTCMLSNQDKKQIKEGNFDSNLAPMSRSFGK